MKILKVLTIFLILTGGLVVQQNVTPKVWRYTYDNVKDSHFGSQKKILMLREYNLSFAKEFKSPIIYYGNSQNYFYIHEYRQKINPNMMYVSFPVFTGPDYLGHMEKVLAYKPSKVIVHLSSLNVQPNYSKESVFYFDRVNIANWKLIYKLVNHDSSFLESAKLFSHFVVNQIFQPFKYSYAYSFSLDHLLSKGSLPRSAKGVNKVHDSGDKVKGDLAMEFMKKAFKKLSKSTPVYLVEGQYDRYQNPTLDLKVKRIFSKLAKETENIHYIETDELYQFKPEDYSDGIHPHFDKGFIYNKSLLKKILPNSL